MHAAGMLTAQALFLGRGMGCLHLITSEPLKTLGRVASEPRGMGGALFVSDSVDLG